MPSKRKEAQDCRRMGRVIDDVLRRGTEKHPEHAAEYAKARKRNARFPRTRWVVVDARDHAADFCRGTKSCWCRKPKQSRPMMLNTEVR